MQDSILKFDGRELIIDRDIITLGRSSENDVSFPDDTNVSRYHAEIEKRGDDHWLIDLQSSNGTAVNAKRVTGERRLCPGDRIVLGGSSELEFVQADPSETGPAIAETEIGGGTDPVTGSGGAGTAVDSLGYEAGSQMQYAAGSAVGNIAGGGGTGPAASSAVSTSSGSTVIIAGAVVGLAVVCAVAAGAFYLTRSSACPATAQITKPETGDTIESPVDIELDTKDAGCVQRAIFTIDGQEVASADGPTFSATLDPKDVPDLADGADHSLNVVLIDNNGNQIPQPGSVIVAFETRAIAKASPTPTATGTNSQPPTKQSGKQPSLVQINEMAQKLVKQFSGNFGYNVSNKQFLQEIQKRTTDYAQQGYSQRAAAYREIITIAFVREQNIDAPLGFILAMSRSKFLPARQADREGLWQLPSALITENKYNGMCGSESLSDPSQNCAARSAALYTKALIFSVFDGDPILTAAAFGKTPQDAGVWKATLPANHSDIWNSIRTADEREQLARFFAAGIVSENPQAFGLTSERPLSDLYRVTMQQ